MLLISATAGLSESATATDDDTRRLERLEGVAGCEAALARQGLIRLRD